MKLKFDSNQQYQLDAIQAVVDLFVGQPKDGDGATRHMDQDRQLSLEATIAKGNSLTLDVTQIVKNTHKIQEKNGIEKSETKEGGFGIPATFPLEIGEKSLKYGMNFSIEMETGTGKLMYTCGQFMSCISAMAGRSLSSWCRAWRFVKVC